MHAYWYVGAGRPLALLLALLLLACPRASAQVVYDDFADGDFTQNPAWTGDTDRFTVVPFGDGNALRADGIAAADTIHLATASSVAYGYWHFRFRHEVSLSNVNGSRIYLVSSSPDLKGALQGYYVQFGTNNLNRVELWRQDGATPDRVRLGISDAIMYGDANTVFVEVTRDEQGTWAVIVDGIPVIGPVVDNTYAASQALGVWVRHNATGRDRFSWTNFLADPDPGDITPPQPRSVAVLDHGATLIVQFDEPLDPETVSPDAFSVDQGIGAPVSATLAEPTAVRLAFEPAIPEGSYQLRVVGVADLAGNVQPGATITFWVTVDEEPPNLFAAEALSPTEVRVVFDEPVQGCDPALYEITPEIGAPVAIECPALDTYVLTLGVALLSGQSYTLRARSIADLAGNVQPETSVTFFFGDPEPAGSGDVVINEIMYAPPPPTSNEWVELLNVSDRAFDLSHFTVADQSREVPIATTPTMLAPGALAVLVRNAPAFEETFPGVSYIAVPNFPTLLNAGDAVVIRYIGGAEPVTIDSVFYRPSWGGAGASLERRNPHGPSNSPTNWATTLDPRGGTPGEPNSIPPDTDPPQIEDVDVGPDGSTLLVWFDEPLDPATVRPEAFSLSGGVGTPAEAVYTGDADPGAALTLRQPLAEGTYTLTVSGVADLVGNVLEDASVEFTFTPDVAPPEIASAFALDASTVRVRFSEPVTPASASEPAHYAISGGIGAPVHVAFAPTGRTDEVDLELGTQLDEGQLYTLTVSGVSDLAGNVLTDGSAIFLFGEADTPVPGDVVVNEIMYREAVGGTEYVEIRNVSDRVFDLSGFTISDRGAPRAITASPVILPPGGYLAIARDLSALRAQFGAEGTAMQMSNLPTLVNSGDAVVLRFGGATIDSVLYSPTWQRPELRDDRGVALERLDPRAPSNAPDNWTSSIHPRGGTPGLPNSVALPPGELPPAGGITVSPSPFSGSAGTIIRYTLAADAGVVRIRIFDGAGRLVRMLEDAALAGNTRTGEVPWNGRDDRGQSLRVGIYIVVLEALDLAGARTEAYRTPVVLAREY